MEATVIMTGSATSSRLPGTSLASSIKLLSVAEDNSFFAAINACGRKRKPAVLSLVNPCSESFVPVSTSSLLPKPLTSLFQECNLHFGSRESLFEHCKSLKLSLLAGEILEVERQTRKQSLSKTWYDQRAGRITASIMHIVVHTSLCSPSLSLVKTICYPEVFSFSSPATDWGRTHEQLALKRYLSNEMAHRDYLSVSAFRVVLNETWPFLGASPDGIVNCSC